MRVGRRPWRAWTGWLNAGLGLWLFAAAFWAAQSATAAWNEAVVGALVAALASIAASATEQAQRATARERAAARGRTGRVSALTAT